MVMSSELFESRQDDFRTLCDDLRSKIDNQLTRLSGGKYLDESVEFYFYSRLPSQTTSSRWQVDKEAIGLSRVQYFSHLCVALPYQI